MKIYLYFFALVLSSFLLSSCKNTTDSSSGTPASATKQDLFPLSVGNHWTYHTKGYDLNTIDTTYTILIANEETYQGHDAFAYTASNYWNDGIYYRSNSDIYNVVSTTSTFLLRYPMSVGASIVVLDTVYSNGQFNKLTFILKDSNEAVLVPAGTFICYHYDQVQVDGTPSMIDTNTKSFFYSPGVGLVQQKNYQKSYSMKTTNLEQAYELVNYQVSK